MLKRVALIAALALSAVPSLADMPRMRGMSPAQPKLYPQPPLRASGAIAKIVAEVAPTSEADLAALRRWNASGLPPTRIGVLRSIDPVRIPIGPVASSTGPVRWSGAVRLRDAARVRLKLTDLSLPVGTRLWIYSPAGEVRGFDGSLAAGGVLWTPSIEGDTAILEVDAPSPFSLTVSQAADIRSLEEVTPDSTDCWRDVACHSTGGVENSATAIARYEVVLPDGIAQCSGGLIIDSDRKFKPYFLTANHCVATSAQAASVEAFWDYRATTCNGPSPTLASRPRTSGASLLVTSESLDMSLLQLSSVPGERWWLGWDTAEIQHGDVLHRVSHPRGLPQRFTTMEVDWTAPACEDLPHSSFIYSVPTLGGIGPGSSGSPVLIGDGRIVGQLYGICGPDADDDCGSNHLVDGALRQAYPLLKSYIDPAPATCAACTPTSTAACLLGSRFKVEMTWRNGFANPATTGTGVVIRYAENKPEIHPTLGPLSETTYFQMFQPARVEVVVKILSGTGINNMFWVFATGLTNNEYWVKVTDTKTCRTWERYNTHGSFSNLTDFEAFPLP